MVIPWYIHWTMVYMRYTMVYYGTRTLYYGSLVVLPWYHHGAYTVPWGIPWYQYGARMLFYGTTWYYYSSTTVNALYLGISG